MIESPDDPLPLDRSEVVAILGALATIVVGASWGYLTDGQAPYGDDNSAHLALMMHIAELWRAGVTDLWWTQSNLGLPLFMAYQPLPALVSGTLAAFVPGTVAQITLFKATIVGLWALMPAAWYLGGRWLGLDRSTALLFGALTLAIRDLHDVGFGFTAATYGGLYTQIWGMFLLPATVGAFRRYVVDRDMPQVVPVALFVATSMAHLFCGMFAGIATLILAVVSRAPRGRRVRRTLGVYVPALALLSFLLGPLVATRDLIGGLPWKNTYYNGWPVVELFRHLLGGDVFDSGRLPWLTVLGFAGVVWTVSDRRHLIDRWAIALGTVSLLLFMGRTNFGSWYDLIPMHEGVNVMRYMNALHFCGLLFAAAAARRIAVALLGWFESIPWRVASGRRVAAVAAVVVVFGYGVERFWAFQSTLSTFDQRRSHVVSLVDHLDDRPHQRFAVDDSLNTSAHFYRDLLPALADRAQLQSYALGYHATLSTYYADYIQWDSPAWARLFNVGAFVAREPFDREVVDDMERTHREGPYQVYSPSGADDWGYFEFVRTPVTVAGDYHAIRPGVRRLLEPAARHRSLPILAGPTEASRRAGRPVMTATDGPPTPWQGPGESDWRQRLVDATPDGPVESEVLASSRGPNWFEAEVRAAGDGERLLLKVNYFPFWHAAVDGEDVAVEHVAPNYMAVDVPAGRHQVRFTYRNPWWQKFGCVAALLTLVVWGGWSWRRSR